MRKWSVFGSAIGERMSKRFTVREASEIFRRTPWTIYRWINEGYLHADKVRDGYLIPETEINRLFKLKTPEIDFSSKK